MALSDMSMGESAAHATMAVTVSRKIMNFLFLVISSFSQRLKAPAAERQRRPLSPLVGRGLKLELTLLLVLSEKDLLPRRCRLVASPQDVLTQLQPERTFLRQSYGL